MKLLSCGMPELPDVCAYVSSLRTRLQGKPLRRIRVLSPYLLRSVDPPLDEFENRVVRDVRRLGKRIIFGFDDDLFIVLHLMIAGRLRWLRPGAKPPGRISVAEFGFAHGVLMMTEASSKKRASLHTVRGAFELSLHDPGGIDVLNCTLGQFAEAIRTKSRTIKRTLTDPHILDGIGNAYSDEILHAARMSPAKRTQSISEAEMAGLFEAARSTLQYWIDRLQKQFADRFPGPGDITAFRDDFAVHGKFEKPCPICATPVQRIRLADSEHNYCPTCQTGGKVLRDRSLSRLLKDDWPKSVEEL